MGTTTVLPASRLPRRTAAVADLYSCTSRLSLKPSCMANPAAPKKPKRPGSARGGEPPAKRARGLGEPSLAATVSIRNKERPCPSKDSNNSTRPSAVVVTKNQSINLQSQLPESTAQPKPKPSIRELIEKARQAKAAEEAIGQGEIERRRTEARRNLEQMVATVEFNDPFLDPADVFMSRQQLTEARDAAARAQARIIEMARRREMEALR